MMSNPIRILQVFRIMNRGGAETMIMNIYRNIDRSKIQFDFMVHTEDKGDFDDEINFLGGKIYRVPRYNGINHFKYKKTWNQFFSNHKEYKIIHGHILGPATIYLRIARNHGLTTIAHSHSTNTRGNIIEKIVKKIMKIPIKYITDYLFACSNEAGKSLYGKKHINEDNFIIIKNAIDTNKYAYDVKIRKKMRELLNVNNNLVIGHVGSFTEPKNHKFLIDIFYEIQKKHQESRLLLLGSGRLEKKVIKKIRTLDLDDKVIVLGNVPNVNEYLQAMDIFVFPSIYEGLPVSLIEAQASGLPCIISNRITSEIVITPIIKKIPLSNTANEWSNIIIQTEYEGRTNMVKNVKKENFDIFSSTNYISNFYLKISN